MIGWTWGLDESSIIKGMLAKGLGGPSAVSSAAPPNACCLRLGTHPVNNHRLGKRDATRDFVGKGRLGGG